MRKDLKLPWTLGLLLAVALLIGPKMARAEDAIEDDFSAWQPRIASSVGVHSQIMRVHSERSNGLVARGTRDLLTSIFKINVGGVSPAMMPAFGKPRLYGRIGYDYVLSIDPVRLHDTNVAFDDVVFAAATDKSALCGNLQDVDILSCDHSLITDGEIDNMWTAGVGVEFNGHFLDQDFKLTVGVEYLGQEVTYVGSGITKDRGGGFRTNRSDIPAGTVLIEYLFPEVSSTVINHTIGPHIGIAASVGQIGPLAVQLFADLTVYFYLDDGDETVTTSFTGFNLDSGGMPTIPTEDTLSFRIEKDAYLTQATTGIRFVWH